MMGMGRGGRTYTVLIEDLLTKLKANREEHVDIVITAQAAFKKKTIERLDAMLAEAKSGSNVSMHLGLVVPSAHTDAFDNAIGLLELTAKAGETKIEIDADEYERFVRNNWEWTDKFRDSNSSYRS